MPAPVRTVAMPSRFLARTARTGKPRTAQTVFMQVRTGKPEIEKPQTPQKQENNTRKVKMRKGESGKRENEKPKQRTG